MPDFGNRKWITASDALDVLTAKGENPGPMQEMLAIYLREGKLTAGARAIWISDQKELRQAWRERPKLNEKLEIPLKYWSSNKNVLEDRALWKWKTSRFHTTLRINKRQRRMMAGVHFLLEDLKRLQPAYFGSGQKKSRGRREETEKRDAGWRIILDLLFSKKLNLTEFKDITELKDEVRKLAKNKDGSYCIGRSGSDEICRMVWPKLKSEDDSVVNS